MPAAVIAPALRQRLLAALDEAQFQFVQAGGPGGQHVNKTASAAKLRFNLETSRSLPAELRQRLRRIAASRISQDGWLTIDARRYRSQERNRDDALNRFLRLLEQAAVEPRPRKPTVPAPGVRRRRLEAKHHRASTKRLRRSPEAD